LVGTNARQYHEPLLTQRQFVELQVKLRQVTKHLDAKVAGMHRFYETNLRDRKLLETSTFRNE